MAKILKIDSDGDKSALLGVGEFGYDNYPAGGDAGRVYVGDGTQNVALARKSEIDTLDTRVSAIEDNTTLAEYGITDAYTKTEVDVLLEGQNEAGEIEYDNTSSSLVAVTVQAAIDELDVRLDDIEAKPANKLDATVAPTVTDDIDAGYSVGSVWMDVTANEAYRCVDATAGVAVWVNTTLTADELNATLIAYDNINSELTATNVQNAVDEVKTQLDKNTAVAGTEALNRYDKILSTLDVIAMDYTSGSLDYVRYAGDDDATVYYRDVMTYDVNGNLAEVNHYYGTADLVTSSATTTLTYDVDGNLITTTYTEV